MVIKDEKYYEKILSGVNEVADIVKKTFGPTGKTIMLFNNANKPYYTKDGISVMRSVNSADDIKRGAIEIIKETVERVTQLAGDGTTTCTILTQAIINQCVKKIINEHVQPNILIDELDFVLKYTIEELKKISTSVDINSKEIKDIAYISTNNDKELANLIASAFKEVGLDGQVMFDLSEEETTTVEYINGMTSKSCLPSEGFINNYYKNCAEYDDAYVLLVNCLISDISEIKNIIGYTIKEDKPLLIVAQKFNEKVLKDIMKNNLGGYTKILAIQADGYGNYSKLENLKDISSITCATIVDNLHTITSKHLGRCKKVETTLYKTTIIKDVNTNNSTLYNERLNILKQQHENEKDFTKKNILAEKIANLIGKIAIIHVGGYTTAIVKEKYDRVEDAINAVRSTLEEGFCLGGGVTYLQLSQKLKNIPDYEHGKEIFTNALQTIIEELGFKNIDFNTWEENISNDINGYDFKLNKWCNLKKEGIIDPTKVLRVALEQAVHVSKLIINSAGAVTNVYATETNAELI